MELCTCERNAEGDVVDEEGRDYGILPSGIPRCGKCRKVLPGEYPKGPFMFASNVIVVTSLGTKRILVSDS
jgi:hypothetical protein